MEDQRFTRRQMLRMGILAGGLALGSRWAPVARADDTRSPIPAPAPSPAKSVIQIWMWGGPAHIDTFDPKPDAGSDYCGPLKKPIQTCVDGIRIGELLPLLAGQADKFSIIRSMTHGINSHETASYVTQTGRRPDRLVFPSAGAVVSRFKGYDEGYRGVVPPYIVLTAPQGRFSEAGFLGQRYKPFATGGDPNRARFVVEGIIAEGVSDERQRARLKLLDQLDSLGKAMPDDARLAALDRSEKGAKEVMFGKARKIFDLSSETDELRKEYGRNKFGQSCLMARRLVEAGVPYITINYAGWDTHKRHFETIRRKLPEMDRGMATLLKDLSARGLLDRTIVWWGGEFGRTPKVKWEAPWNGGRGHHGHCFSAVVAGGGFRGGHVVGASDERGERVVERPVLPRDLIGSIYKLLGINPDGPLPNPKGLDVRVLPARKDGDQGGGLLKEIMVS